MFLKRLYDHSSGEPKLKCVKVLRVSKFQKITPRFIEQQVASGLLSIADGHISIKTEDGKPDLKYKILRAPGYFCCHCSAALGNSTEGKEHVAVVHPGVESPDEGNPLGFRKDNFYFCELVEGGV